MFKSVTIFLLTLCLINGYILEKKYGCSIETALPKLQRTSFDFATQLTKEVAKNEGNFALAPLSLWNILATLSQGASGETLAELQTVLKLRIQPCFVSKYSDILRSIYKDIPQVVNNQKGLLLMDTNVDIEKSFSKKVDKLSEIVVLDFLNSEKATMQVNDIVSNVTENRNHNAAVEDYFLSSYFVIMDVIRFGGEFKHTFTNLGDNSNGTANMIISKGAFNRTTLPLLKAEVLELPYANKYSMLVFIPGEGQTTDDIISRLNTTTLRSIFARFEKGQPKDLVVVMPTFTMRTSLNLKDTLAKVGVQKVFDPSQADLSQISTFPIFLSMLKQEFILEVEGSSSSDPNEDILNTSAKYLIDKPFVFMIVDRSKEIVLFTGVYGKPNL